MLILRTKCHSEREAYIEGYKDGAEQALNDSLTDALKVPEVKENGKAVKEMMDYLENGNITNSVNYPRCDMGICENAGRIAILHKNISNMIGQFTSVFGSSKVNIQDMTNKSKGDVAYTLIDVSDPVGDDILEKISAIDGVFRVRKVK
jgi:hypothetical protein